MPPFTFGTGRAKATSQAIGQGDANRPISLPKVKLMHLRQDTVNNKQLSCPIENAIVITVKMPPNHQLLNTHNQSIKLGANRNIRYSIAQAALESNGFAIKPPSIPKSLNRSIDNSDVESFTSEIEKHNGLVAAGTTLESLTRDWEKISPDTETVVQQLGALLSTLKEINCDKIANWSDLLVKPVADDVDQLCSGAMTFDNNQLTLKLVFKNEWITGWAKATLMHWAAAVEMAQQQHAELTTMIDQFNELGKELTTPKNDVDVDGFKKHSNKKKNAIKDSDKIWNNIREYCEFKTTPHIHSTNVVACITTRSIAVDYLHERYVSLELRKFSTEVDLTDIKSCAKLHTCFEAAGIKQGTKCKIEYRQTLDPREARCFVIIPITLIEPLLKAVVIDDIALCEVRGSIVEPGSKLPVSVNLLEGYKAACATQTTNAQSDSEMLDADIQHQNNQPIVRITYAAIARHGYALQLKQPSVRPPVQSDQTIKQNVHDRPSSLNHQPKKRRAAEPIDSHKEETEMERVLRQVENLTARVNNLTEENKQLKYALNESIKQSTEPVPTSN